jgi:hypothetical protein
VVVVVVVVVVVGFVIGGRAPIIIIIIIIIIAGRRRRARSGCGHERLPRNRTKGRDGLLIDASSGMPACASSSLFIALLAFKAT